MNWQPGGPRQSHPFAPSHPQPSGPHGAPPPGAPQHAGHPQANPFAPPPSGAHPFAPPPGQGAPAGQGGPFAPPAGPGAPFAPPGQAPAGQGNPFAPPAGPFAPPAAAHPFAPQPGFQPPPQQPPGLLVPPRPFQPGPPGQPMVIDVGKSTARRAVIGATVAGGIGLVAIISGLVGATDGDGSGFVAVAIGAVFLLIGLLPVFMRDKVFRPVKLVIEQQGIRWDDPKGKPWALPWNELGGIAVSTREPIEVPGESMQDKIVGAATEKMVGKNMLVRIDLFPGDPAFRSRHLEMEHLWEFHAVRGGYRLPLGKVPKWVPMIDAAIKHFQPSLYHGVVEEKGIMGLV